MVFQLLEYLAAILTDIAVTENLFFPVTRRRNFPSLRIFPSSFKFDSTSLMAVIGSVTVANLIAPVAAKAEVVDSVYALADGSLGDWFGGLLYSAGQQANAAVLDQLASLNFTRYSTMYPMHLYCLFPP
ncbi:cytochrome c-type biogenesis ccda-like chloroplastic protein 2 [Prosopis cineraria]|uniref:cytochrome c-type biogenesis ccda-like chloroplastic protein 2 n=1 Tax=Prosopis cineraria TaxID=364024 RepID=UPI00240FA5B3|nr:cytochrome c-type biogenesis ccda-like chloroplastic protein 2 [Prosopis cineraria]